jgi:hypothetical protein
MYRLVNLKKLTDENPTETICYFLLQNKNTYDNKKEKKVNRKMYNHWEVDTSKGSVYFFFLQLMIYAALFF